MEPALKHRLIGAAVLSALAIIFLPMLIVGKDPNETASKVPLKVPAAPAGDFETKELPLAAPASGVPDGGVVGMNTSRPAAASPASPAASPGADGSTASDAPPAAAPSGAASAAASPAAPQPAVPTAASPASAKPTIAVPAPVATAKPPAAASPATVAAAPPPAASPAAVSPPSAPIPAANAGGHYVVSLGTYANAGNAQSLVASLKAKQLPAYAEVVTVAGKSATRVRIGPFQQRGDAEAARLKAQQARSDMPASVTALDAATPAPEVPAPAVVAATKPAASPASAKPAMASPTSIKPAAASTATAKPVASPAASGKTPATSSPATATTASPAADKPTTPSPAAAGRGYAVQVSAFAIESQANALRDKLRAAGFVAYSEKVQAESGTRFRVRVGPEADRDAADHLRTELSTKMNLSGMVVAYP
ncbi:MAG TPA: SPOR domain-containing protein [Xanthomonadaceae bacterium]|jgi:cell division septation protein DedD